MKLFAQEIVPLRASLHAYGVLSLVASVAWFKRGSHKFCLRGAIVFATHLTRPLDNPFSSVSGVVRSRMVLALPRDQKGQQLPAREGAMAAKTPPPSVTASYEENKHHSGPINIGLGQEILT